MKQLPRACCLVFIALTTAACSSIPDVQNSFRELDLGSDAYVVRAGDTLESIAFRYKLQPDTLLALNPSKGRHFAPGTHLYVRKETTSLSSVAGRSIDSLGTRRIVPASSRADDAVTAPVYSPRAVLSVEKQVPVNTSVYTPAVGALASDIALLNPEFGQELPRLRNGALDTGAISGGRRPREEIIEETFSNGSSAATGPVVGTVSRTYKDGWVWPTQGQVARGFSPVKDGRHGVDIAGLPGQQVVAVKDGTVAYSGKDPSGTGNLIIVRHDDSLLTAYSHAQNLYVAEDDSVRAGDPIATLGWNAQQESVLRFEVRQNGNSLNPMDFLSNR